MEQQGPIVETEILETILAAQYLNKDGANSNFVAKDKEEENENPLLSEDDKEQLKEVQTNEIQATNPIVFLVGGVAIIAAGYGIYRLFKWWKCSSPVVMADTIQEMGLDTTM